VGLALTGAMVGLGATTDAFPLLLGCLVLAGCGFSAGNPATSRAVVEWFPAPQRGLAMGVKQTGLTLGGLGGALLLPPLASRAGWSAALGAAGLAALLGAAAVGFLYRPAAALRSPGPHGRPRLSELGPYLGRREVRTVLACGLALSMVQASVLAYLALFLRERLQLSAVSAGRYLALAQAGGAAGRVLLGFASDRWMGGRRRPGVVGAAVVAALGHVAFAVGPGPPPLLAAVAWLAGAGAFGWVGLYFALVAEIGGARHAGLLTGVAVVAAWSGVLVGPPLFGVWLDVWNRWEPAWGALAVLSLLAAVALARLPPLVQRGGR
jgi:sugar phosphate permease